MGAVTVRNGRLVGQTMTFTLVLPFAGNLELPVSATLTGDTFTATTTSPMGEARMNGRRLPPGATDDDYELLWDGHSHDLEKARRTVQPPALDEAGAGRLETN
jgi:hypothetical protein